MASFHRALVILLLLCQLTFFVRSDYLEERQDDEYDWYDSLVNIMTPDQLEDMLSGHRSGDRSDSLVNTKPVHVPAVTTVAPTPPCNTHVTAKGLKCRCNHPCGRHGVSNVWCYTNDKDWAWCCKMPCNANTKKCYGSEHWWGRRKFDCNPSQNTCSVTPGACVTVTTFSTKK